MAIPYARMDLPIRIRWADQDEGEIIVSVEEADVEERFPIEGLDEGLQRVAGQPGFRRKVDARPDQRSAITALAGANSHIFRITLEIEDATLAGLDWERSLTDALDQTLKVDEPIVRVSPVRPRALTIPLTLPLRFVQVDPGEFSLPREIHALLPAQTPTALASTVQIKTLSLQQLREMRPNKSWPTAEVLHFGQTVWPAETEELLATADADKPATLGWLTRLTERWQTRLVVLQASSAPHYLRLLSLAAAVVARGGPAILVVAYELFLYKMLYDAIVHSEPLDEPSLRFHAGKSSLYVGSGREELLSISSLESQIARSEVQSELATEAVRRSRTIRSSPDVAPLTTQGIKGVLDRLVHPVVNKALPQILLPELLHATELAPEERPFQGVEPEEPNITELEPEKLDHAEREPPMPHHASFGFDESVSEALETEPQVPPSVGKPQLDLPIDLPATYEPSPVFELAKELDNVRKMTLLGTDPVSLDLATAPRRRSPKTKKRHTSCSLWQGDGADIDHIDPKKGRLRVRQVYHLRVQITPNPQELVGVIGAIGLLEEVFKWSDEKAGAWLEVAITGLDFDVLGDPVQELWLPREGPTEPLYFAIRPKVTGVARVRICVYYKNAVLQSIRVAALVADGSDAEEPAATAQEALAAALDLRPEHLDEASIAMRLEYGGAPHMEDLAKRKPRALSIVANHLQGQSVFSVKAAGHFRVRTDNNVPRYVENLRNALETISTHRVVKTDPTTDTYRFGLGGDTNAGSEQQLREALHNLAQYGNQLYKSIVASDKRKELQSTLEQAGQTIEIAHVLLDKVIPWSMLYDRHYDARDPSRTLCMAPLQEGPSMQCGQHPTCVRHAKTDGSSIPDASAVVCPLGFWGFRHRIELPVRQVDDEATEEKAAAVDEVQCTRPANLVLLLNESLKRAQQHATDLEQLASKPEAGIHLTGKSSNRKAILDSLSDPNLDVIYAYCHAARDDETGNFAPNLVFRVRGGRVDERITNTDLDDGNTWEHHPLVFLNACGTGGFSPDALSPFLRTLVEDRHAGGVVTTEVGIWEQLSTEFAQLFLQEFFKGSRAADAILSARWALLRRNNPLGLVYTLYASADLRLGSG